MFYSGVFLSAVSPTSREGVSLGVVLGQPEAMQNCSMERDVL